MLQTQTQLAGERTAITSVTIGDGIGGGVGTVITKENESLLEIWRENDVQKVPLTVAAAAPELLEALKLAHHNLPSLPSYTGSEVEVEILNAIAKAEGRAL